VTFAQRFWASSWNKTRIVNMPLDYDSLSEADLWDLTDYYYSITQ